MKRHAALAPLSREHHSALILAQLLKRGAPLYKGLPVNTRDKITYAIDMFRNSLKEHFRKEEILLAKLKHCHEDIPGLAGEIVIEHSHLEASFLNLDKSTAPEDDMNDLGNALEAHIRKEERLLFPLLQEHCSEKELQETALLLQQKY